jgi:hypothetical protein
MIKVLNLLYPLSIVVASLWWHHCGGIIVVASLWWHHCGGIIVVASKNSIF